MGHARKTVALINMVLDPKASPDLPAILRAHFHNHHVAEALRDRGFRVVCVQAHDRWAEAELDGIEIRGFPANLPRPLRLVRLFGAERGHAQTQENLARLLRDLRPDVAHVYGLSHGLSCAAALWEGQAAGGVLSWSDHGGTPPRHPIRRRRLRGLVERADAITVPSTARLQMWGQGLGLRRTDHLVVQPEISTRFAMTNQRDARARTGMQGAPVICSTSNLLPGKRPLVMLQAFERALKTLPEARLYLCYRYDDMLDEVQDWLARREDVAARVILMGQVPREGMADVYNSADIYLLTSRAEIGLTSLAEATACGAVPVVPSLACVQEMTCDGAIGQLFAPEAGPRDVAAGLVDAARALTPDSRAQMRRHFEQHLSYDRIVDGMVAAWTRAGKG